MTDAEKIKVYAPECIEDMNETGVLASVSLALILAGKMEKPDGAALKKANAGRKNKGPLLYPGIGKCKSFDEAAKILGDDGTLCALEKKWGLSRRFDDSRAEELKVTSYMVVSTRVKIYAGPGKEYAQFDRCCKKGEARIVKEKNGFGKLKGQAGWIELAKVRRS